MDYENQTIEMHIIGRGTETFKVSELTNEELEDLWYNANNETARFALRERTGVDLTWTFDTFTKEDYAWRKAWRERQKEKAALEGEK